MSPRTRANLGRSVRSYGVLCSRSMLVEFFAVCVNRFFDTSHPCIYVPDFFSRCARETMCSARQRYTGRHPTVAVMRPTTSGCRCCSAHNWSDCVPFSLPHILYPSAVTGVITICTLRRALRVRCTRRCCPFAPELPSAPGAATCARLISLWPHCICNVIMRRLAIFSTGEFVAYFRAWGCGFRYCYSMRPRHPPLWAPL